jgi:hypothetical protein
MAPRSVRVLTAKPSVVGRVFLEATIVELWPFSVLSLQSIPRVQNPTISVRAGEGILGEVKVTISCFTDR